MLQKILNFAIHEASKRGWGLEVTSVYRDDGGVHSTAPIRGIDVVPKDRSEKKMEWLREIVNSTFDYGKGKLQVCPDIDHGTSPHNHLQARNETTRRSDEIV